MTNPAQKMHGVAWKLVNQTVTEICPTWNNAVNANKGLSACNFAFVIQAGSSMIYCVLSIRASVSIKN